MNIFVFLNGALQICKVEENLILTRIFNMLVRTLIFSPISISIKKFSIDI